MLIVNSIRSRTSIINKCDVYLDSDLTAISDEIYSTEYEFEIYIWIWVHIWAYLIEGAVHTPGAHIKVRSHCVQSGAVRQNVSDDIQLERSHTLLPHAAPHAVPDCMEWLTEPICHASACCFHAELICVVWRSGGSKQPHLPHQMYKQQSRQ